MRSSFHPRLPWARDGRALCGRAVLGGGGGQRRRLLQLVLEGKPPTPPPAFWASGALVAPSVKVNTKMERSSDMRMLHKPSFGNRFPTDVQPVPGGSVTLISHLLNFLSLANCGVHAGVMSGPEACELCPSSSPTCEGGPLPPGGR